MSPGTQRLACRAAAATHRGPHGRGMLPDATDIGQGRFCYRKTGCADAAESSLQASAGYGDTLRPHRAA